MEVESGSPSAPSRHAAMSTASAKAKGWHLLLACPPPPPPPPAQARSSWKSLSLPSLLLMTCACPSCLWLGTVPRVLHLWKARPSQNGPVVLCRVALCFSKKRSSSKAGSGEQDGEHDSLVSVPADRHVASSQIHLGLHTWTLWHHQSCVHPRPPREHADP